MENERWVDEELIKKAKKEKVRLVFDRFNAQQPQCPFGMGGVCCVVCHNGPCRIIPGKAEKGICGASVDTIVARNWVRHTAAGANCHSDHAKEAVEVLLKIAEGKTKAYRIKDEKKLRAIAKKLKVKSTGPVKKVAKAVALKAMEDFRRQKDFDAKEGEYLNRIKLHAPKERIETWKKLGVLPYNSDHETSRALHQATCNWQPTLSC